MKNAFTMIELVFVIVVIGIIASIGVPKLMAVRDDARIVTELDKVSTTMSDIVNIYNARAIIENNETFSKCFRIYAHEINGSMYLGVEDISDGRVLPSYCPDASRVADDNSLKGRFVVKVTGSSIYDQ